MTKKVLSFSIKATVCTLNGYLCLAMCCQKWLERVNTRCGLRFRNPVEHWPLLSLWHPGPSPLVMRLLFAHSCVFHGHFLCKIACSACPQIKALAHEDRRACVYFTGQFKQLLEQNVVKKKNKSKQFKKEEKKEFQHNKNRRTFGFRPFSTLICNVSVWANVEPPKIIKSESLFQGKKTVFACKRGGGKYEKQRQPQFH